MKNFGKCMENYEKCMDNYGKCREIMRIYGKLWKMYGNLLLRYILQSYVFISCSNYGYCTKTLYIIENFMSLRASYFLFYLVLLNCVCYEMYVM